MGCCWGEIRASPCSLRSRPPSLREGGVVGAVLGGISGVPCVLRLACTCLLRGAKGRSPARLRGAGRCQMSRARIVLRSSQAWG